MILIDRNMYWDESKITRILNILLLVYKQLLCWRPLSPLTLLESTEVPFFPDDYSNDVRNSGLYYLN
jgi:hypothetical protein